MPKPKVGRSAYEDVIWMMNAAVERGTLTFRCENEGKAIRALQRMNQYRIMDRQGNQNMLSLYDNFIYKRRGELIIAETKDAVACIEAFDKDGNRISVEELMAASGEYTPSLKEAAAAYDREGPSEIMKLAAQQAKEHAAKENVPNAQKLHFDPTKPLLEDC